MTAPAWRVRVMEPADIATVLAIQNESPEAARWTAPDYQQACTRMWYGTVAEGQGSVAGFLVGRTSANELEIMNMAVRHSGRRRGVGSLLLADALGFGHRSGAKAAFLEVRESNAAAAGFYERHGFSVKGRRVRYYSDPIEDGLILWRHLS